MPKFTIPETILVKTQTKEYPLPFLDWILNGIVHDPSFGRSLTTLEARKSIKKELKDKKIGDEVELRQEDYEVLASIVRTPTHPYQPEIAEQVLSYMYTVVNPK